MKKGRTTKAKPEPAEAPAVAEQAPAEPEASARPAPDLSAADYLAHAALELGAVASGLDGIRAEEIEQLEADQAQALALALEAPSGRIRKFVARLRARA